MMWGVGFFQLVRIFFLNFLLVSIIFLNIIPCANFFLFQLIIFSIEKSVHEFLFSNFFGARILSVSPA